MLKQILIIALFVFVSCGSLELKVSTLNHLSTIDRFNQLKKQEVNTDLFSINAPLINGWIFDNKYGNSWEYSEFARYPRIQMATYQIECIIFLLLFVAHLIDRKLN